MQSKHYAIIDAMSVMVPYGMYNGDTLSAEIDGKKVATNMCFGFLKFVVGLIRDGQIPIVCMDPKLNFRKKENSNYKSGRQKLNIPDFETQIGVCTDALMSSNVNVLLVEGYEADDLVVACARKLANGIDKVTMYSNDFDLTQAVNENIGWSRVHKRKKYVINDVTRDNYEEAFSMPYNTTLLYKSTVGDVGDGIKGIKGFGAVAYDKLLDAVEADGYIFPEIRPKNLEPEILERYFTGTKLEQALESYGQAIARDVEVVLDFSVPINRRTLSWWCMKYDMKSLSKILDESLF